jgi:hypothetical protein
MQGGNKRGKVNMLSFLARDSLIVSTSVHIASTLNFKRVSVIVKDRLVLVIVIHLILLCRVFL